MGHNIHRFDVGFLVAEARRLDMSIPDCCNYIDTAAWYKGLKLGMAKRPNETCRAYALRVLSIPVSGLHYSIPSCVRELGIDAGEAAMHDASSDAYCTHKILQALIAW